MVILRILSCTLRTALYLNDSRASSLALLMTANAFRFLRNPGPGGTSIGGATSSPLLSNSSYHAKEETFSPPSSADERMSEVRVIFVRLGNTLVKFAHHRLE